MACRHFRMPVPASAWYRLLDDVQQVTPDIAAADLLGAGEGVLS
jgi:hypothetical protein